MPSTLVAKMSDGRAGAVMGQCSGMDDGVAPVHGRPDGGLIPQVAAVDESNGRTVSTPSCQNGPGGTANTPMTLSTTPPAPVHYPRGAVVSPHRAVKRFHRALHLVRTPSSPPVNRLPGLR